SYITAIKNSQKSVKINLGSDKVLTSQLNSKASASVASDQAQKVVDGDILDHSSWTGKNYPCWLRLDFEMLSQVSGVKIFSGCLAYAYYPSTEGSVKDFELQYLDGGKWKRAMPPIKDSPRFTGEDPEFGIEYKFDPVVTNSIRLYITGTNDPGTRVSSPKIPIVPEQERSVHIREIKIYGIEVQ
ncbi:unnamed protein product, partial [marine sediment metagenome]